eukprot:CAMPEP_0204908978 /NCGR_PEP_ID=MMETSP1397-20131031/7809_1 /ASSEMBLY_ACC=CAM_ASM_000891 /TAXON_ID=49980 /ORGANISM="Climacostomum Climacostomum virens, Strain Stock W-24" /LENGTH=493 /DNA_ID=CAMNT_0052078685 /DNA_START=382 /DNA_END=1863 /DNA_ORIENTATION=+
MKSGQPKKGGAGGNFTWGNPGVPTDSYEDDEYSDEEAKPVEDPTESDAPVTHVQLSASFEKLNPTHWKFDVTQLKLDTRAKLDETFAQEAYTAFVNWVKSLERPKFHSFIIARILKIALEKSDKQQQMAWGLIELLTSAKIFTPRDIRRAFDRLYRGADDLIMDSPLAPEVILDFLHSVIQANFGGPRLVLRVPFQFYQLGRGSLFLSEIKHEEVVVGELLEGLAAVKRTILQILEEYYAGAAASDIIDFLNRPHHRLYTSLVVRKSIELAFDRPPKDKELCSRLLAELGSVEYDPEVYVEAFDDLLWNIEEYVKDVPDAVEQLSKFIARATIDEVLPANYAADAQLHEDEALQLKVLTQTHAMLRGSSTRLENVWRPRVDQLADLQVQYQLIIKEFLDSHDLSNVALCLKELHSPHYMHEFIRKGLELAMDRSPAQQESFVNLLLSLKEQDLLPLSQVQQGLERLAAKLPELQLDCPRAQEYYEEAARRLIN